MILHSAIHPFSLKQPIFSKAKFGVVLGLGLAAQITTLAFLFFLVRFWNAILINNVHWFDRWLDLIFMLTMILAGQGLRFFYARQSTVLGFQVAADLRQRLWRVLLAGPVLTGREKTDTAQEGPTRVLQVVDALEPWYSVFLPQAALALFVPLGMAVAVLYLDPMTGLVLVITGPLLPLFLALLGIKAKAKAERQWRTLARLRFLFLESLQGLKTLKIFGKGQERLRQLEQGETEFRKHTLDVLRTAFLSALVLEWAATLGTALVAVEVALRLVTDRLDFLTALLVLLWTPEFYKPIRQLGLAFHASLDARTAYKDHPELFAAIDSKPAELQPVRCAVPELTINTASGDTYEVKPGQPLIITGPSGTGKTRMLLQYLGLLERPELPPILTPSLEWSCMGWLPQQSVFFEGSLWDNLCPHGRIDKEKVWNVIQKVGLTQRIESDSSGLEMRIQELGQNFSGGERRRLALARLLLLDRPLWILDEPLAGLDSESVAMIMDLIETEAQQRTVVMVTHHIESLQRASRVFFLRKGQIEAVGDHAHLCSTHEAYAQTVEGGAS